MFKAVDLTFEKKTRFHQEPEAIFFLSIFSILVLCFFTLFLRLLAGIFTFERILNYSFRICF